MPSVAQAVVKEPAKKRSETTTTSVKSQVARKRPAPKGMTPSKTRLMLKDKREIFKDIIYSRSRGVHEFVSRVAAATPMEMVSAERVGVNSLFLKDVSKHMQVPAVRIFDIVGVPKATVEKKAATQEPIAGAGGQAALGLARLLAIANDIVANSTSPEAEGFDAGKWLGQWIERPQPSLGGKKPADLIGTPTGLTMVARVLGAIESGAYL
jgi:putative toxin-antitoxin system antitoxin component (TIGR02293 family)